MSDEKEDARYRFRLRDLVAVLLFGAALGDGLGRPVREWFEAPVASSASSAWAPPPPTRHVVTFVTGNSRTCFQAQISDGQIVVIDSATLGGGLTVSMCAR